MKLTWNLADKVYGGLPATIGMDGRVMYPRVSDFPRYNME